MEYEKIELGVKQKLEDAKPKAEYIIIIGTQTTHMENKSLNECTPSIDFEIQECTPRTTDRITICRKLPNIEQILNINDSMLSSRILSINSPMEIVQEDTTLMAISTQKRVEQNQETPRTQSTLKTKRDQKRQLRNYNFKKITSYPTITCL